MRKQTLLSVIDGQDIWQVLTKGAMSPHEAYFYHVSNELKGVRSGNWKLILDKGQPEALYSLDTDINESRDVLKAQAQVAQALLAKIDAFKRDLSQNSRPAGFVENPQRLSK